MTWLDLTNLFKPSIYIDNSLRVDKKNFSLVIFLSSEFLWLLSVKVNVVLWCGTMKRFSNPGNRLRSDLSAPVWGPWQLIFGFEGLRKNSSDTPNTVVRVQVPEWFNERLAMNIKLVVWMWTLQLNQTLETSEENLINASAAVHGNRLISIQSLSLSLNEL